MTIREEIRAILRALRRPRRYSCHDDSLLCRRCLYTRDRHEGGDRRCPGQ